MQRVRCCGDVVMWPAAQQTVAKVEFVGGSGMSNVAINSDVVLGSIYGVNECRHVETL